MGGRNPAGEVRLLTDGLHNLAQGKDDHCNKVKDQQVLSPDKEGKPDEHQQLTDQQTADILQAADPLGQQRCAHDDHHRIDAGQGPEQDSALLGINLLQIEREQEIELAVYQDHSPPQNKNR